MKKVTILGCGWLGFALIKALKKDYSVVGTWRSDKTKEKLDKEGIKSLHVNLLENELNDEFFDIDVLCILVSPSKEASYIDMFQPLISHPKFTSIKKVIFTSSTSVYNNASNPILQVEKALHVKKNLCILRMAGLMGEGRYLAKYYPSKSKVKNALTPVNHIHQSDAVGLIEAVIKQNITGTYDACAPEHPSKQSVIEEQCKLLHVNTPSFEQKSENKEIIDSSKLINATNYKFIYPNPVGFPL